MGVLLVIGTGVRLASGRAYPIKGTDCVGYVGANAPRLAGGPFVA